MEGSNRGEGRNRPENIEIVKKYIEKGHPLKSARSLTALEYWHASRMEKAKARIETLEEHAYHDKLTGLANRRVLDERLKEVFALARRQKINLSVFMIDLDNFTAYNREYGHAGGDDFLKNFASILKNSLRRESDMAFRYGGEEFAVLLPDTDENGALQVAEILRTSVEQLTEAATVSVGIATYSKDNQMRFRTPGELIEASDKALYEAKNTGKNRVVAWTPSLSSQE